MKPAGVLKTTLLAATLALVGYWEAEDPAILSNVTLRVEDTGHLHAGDYMMVTRAFCQDREAVADSAVRELAGDFTYKITNRAVQTKPGCYEVKSVAIQIPISVTPGDYSYRFGLRYFVNPLKTKFVQLPDAKVKIYAPGE